MVWTNVGNPAVTNKQVRQPVLDRYQQHSMAPLTQGANGREVNDNTPQAAKERAGLSGYPRIPRVSKLIKLAGIWDSPDNFVLNWPAECIVRLRLDDGGEVCDDQNKDAKRIVQATGVGLHRQKVA